MKPLTVNISDDDKIFSDTAHTSFCRQLSEFQETVDVEMKQLDNILHDL
jgi:hypothetical protein